MKICANGVSTAGKAAIRWRGMPSRVIHCAARSRIPLRNCRHSANAFWGLPAGDEPNPRQARYRPSPNQHHRPFFRDPLTRVRLALRGPDIDTRTLFDPRHGPIPALTHARGAIYQRTKPVIHTEIDQPGDPYRHGAEYPVRITAGAKSTGYKEVGQAPEYRHANGGLTNTTDRIGSRNDIPDGIYTFSKDGNRVGNSRIA